MNQKQLWSVVALSTTVAGVSSVASATTPKQNSPSHNISTANQANSENLQFSAITKIHVHQLAGRQATTLYVRNLPFLTFTAEESVGKENISPTEKANLIASKINQLVSQKVDANQITVSWKKDRHSIKINGEELVEINSYTRLPDTTDNLAQDALQATNRLRRIIGGAKPLSQIVGITSVTKKISEVSIVESKKIVEPEKIVEPKLSPKKTRKLRCSAACRQTLQQQSQSHKPTTKPQRIPKKIQRKHITPENFGKTRSSSSGMASYYGNESGSRTATGERFNPYALTAAHRTLPFGTRIRVTNLWNGRSVIVRINDRGPFIRSRIIDVSYGAARHLGMIGSGVASVKIEVLG